MNDHFIAEHFPGKRDELVGAARQGVLVAVHAPTTAVVRALGLAIDGWWLERC
jgi:hypothetical protein